MRSVRRVNSRREMVTMNSACEERRASQIAAKAM